ncbi:hypothetical protein PRUPE_6G012200 [Prunus persica]|uniref:Uncharacterized protein n=1 Tax=Prunus persica TaxID=3760 RepID=M5WAI9_PRUPE|nr:hypothetical protein PRUPE_6G012200 [Prunus persica]
MIYQSVYSEHTKIYPKLKKHLSQRRTMHSRNTCIQTDRTYCVFLFHFFGRVCLLLFKRQQVMSLILHVLVSFGVVN